MDQLQHNLLSFALMLDKTGTERRTVDIYCPGLSHERLSSDLPVPSVFTKLTFLCFFSGAFSQFGGQQYMREEVYNFPTEYSTKTSLTHSSLDPHFAGKGFPSATPWSLKTSLEDKVTFIGVAQWQGEKLR